MSPSVAARRSRAVVPTADPASFIAVGITPGDDWATEREGLAVAIGS